MKIPLILQQPNELLKTLSKRFKERRLIKKISQADLAEKSNVGISKIRRLEQAGDIQLLDLIKLLDAINEIDEIFINLWTSLQRLKMKWNWIC